MSEPREGTVECWALAFVASTSAADKLGAVPPAAPWSEHAADGGVVRRIAAPGRPAQWRVVRRTQGAVKPGALARPEERARMLHLFAHHELQAAELFAWALLAFPDAPREFRAGLLRLCGEELEHLRAYLSRLEAHGERFGDHPLRDWFWERVPSVRSPLEFVALQGLGLEGANLDHAARWARLFRDADDEDSARVIERVEADEVGHVAFARRWFAELGGAPLTYERWAASLPAPLTPSLFHGAPFNERARRRAGLDDEFLARLEASGPALRARSAP